MKKIVKTVTKQVNEEVLVCDTCDKEKTLPIDWKWSSSSPYDSCNFDHGSCQFCSVECFASGIEKAVEDRKGDDFNRRNFTLSSRGDGQEVIDLFKRLINATS